MKKYKLRVFTRTGVLRECLVETDDADTLAECFGFGVFPLNIQVDLVEVGDLIENLEPQPDLIIDKNPSSNPPIVGAHDKYISK